MLKVQEFILNNPNWEKEIQSKPYFIKVGRNENYVLLKYNQIDSDFSEDMVRECRGLILDEENNYEVVCKPFNKFFNYGEEHAAEIDWASAKIQAKIDGSIMKLWWSEKKTKWIVSTNGTIFAENANLPFADVSVKTFFDMFMKAYNKIDVIGNPSADSTHIFELVGKNNRVVIPYEKTEIYYLASINNKKYYEYFDEAFGKVKRPKEYSFSSLNETIEFSKSDSFNTFRNEGFVVSDKFNNRIKIKTQDYLRIHRLRGETNPTPKRFLELMRTNESPEFLSYFPEYQSDYDIFKKVYNDYLKKMDSLLEYFSTIKDLPRKEFAIEAKKTVNPSFLFGLLDEKWATSTEYMNSVRDKNLIEDIYKEY